MKTKPLMILSFLLALSINGFSQKCPCVKTAIIGNDANATVIHNNKIRAMNDTIIDYGNSIVLRTLDCTGEATWFPVGSVSMITNPKVSPTATTEFIVKSSLDDCPDVYDTVKITVKNSIAGINDVNEIFVYPNPTTGDLMLNSVNKQFTAIKITDINGKQVLQFNNTSESLYYKLNIANLQAGLYFLNISLTNNAVISKQIIKN
jgi:hypothetical protein